MSPRRLLLSAGLALVLVAPACSASGGSDASPTTTKVESSKTTTTTKKVTTTTSGVDTDDAVDTITSQLSGAGDFTTSQARCFAQAFVDDASDDGIEVVSSRKADIADLSSKDKQVFIDSADGCIEVSDLADKAAEGAVSTLGDKVPLTGGESTCISANISNEYDSSGQFLYDISTDEPDAETIISKAIGSCIQPDSLKALITAEIGAGVDPAVADCVAQGFIDQNGGTAGAFEVLRQAGSGADTSAVEQQVTAIAQSCAATGGAGG